MHQDPRFFARQCPARDTNPAADRRNRRHRERRARSAADPGPDQRHPAILPQRLHGALLERPDRRRSGAALLAAARVEPSAACQQAVSAIKAPAPTAERQPPKAAPALKTDVPLHAAARRTAAPASARHTREGARAVEEGAARGDRPGLRRRLPHASPRHSARRRGGHRPPEAQRDDVVGALPARARAGRGRRCRQKRQHRRKHPAACSAGRLPHLPRRAWRRRRRRSRRLRCW